MATGTAATFASPGITVSVPDNSTTTFCATVTNGANQTSACSTSAVTYVEDSSLAPDPNDPGNPGGDTEPPETTITKDPPKRTDAERVKFKFVSDEVGASFQCKLDKRPFKACTSPKKIKVDEGKHKFSVHSESRATDHYLRRRGGHPGDSTRSTRPLRGAVRTGSNIENSPAMTTNPAETHRQAAKPSH